MNTAEPHSTEPNGALRPLLTQKPTLSPCLAMSAAGTPCATGRIEHARPVDVHRHALLGRERAQLCHVVERDRRPARAVVRGLDGDQCGAELVGCEFRGEMLGDLVEIRRPARRLDRPVEQPGERGDAAHLAAPWCSFVASFLITTNFAGLTGVDQTSGPISETRRTFFVCSPAQSGHAVPYGISEKLRATQFVVSAWMISFHGRRTRRRR